jgi:tetratricopeptide (TPR) repeat protein
LLADLFRGQGRTSEAQAQFHEAAELYAGLKADVPTNAYYLQEEAFTMWQLGRALDAAGLAEAAASAYTKSISLHRELVATFPEEWTARSRLAIVLFDHGDRDEAAAVLSEAERATHILTSADEKAIEESYFWLGLGFYRLGEATKAASAFSNAADYGNTTALNQAAWLLATYPDPEVRDGTKAVDLATKAVEETGRANADFLDTLAAAYAESGDFAEAVRVQQEAIALLPAADADRIADFTSRLRLFESDTPFRDNHIMGNTDEREQEAAALRDQ